jgi:hypothetical protein
MDLNSPAQLSEPLKSLPVWSGAHVLLIFVCPFVLFYCGYCVVCPSSKSLKNNFYIFKQLYLISPPGFSGVHVTRSLVLCVMFCRSLFVLFYFFFLSLCFCSSSIDGFWLPPFVIFKLMLLHVVQLYISPFSVPCCDGSYDVRFAFTPIYFVEGSCLISYRHDMAEILLILALSTINLSQTLYSGE